MWKRQKRMAYRQFMDRKFCSNSCSNEFRKEIPKIKISKNCKHCNTMFYKPEWITKKKQWCTTNYCSDKCRYKSISDRSKPVCVYKKCLVCKEAFTRKDEKSWGLWKYKKTCSIECQYILAADKRKGEHNPSWKGGITPLNHTVRGCIKNEFWKKEILKRDNYTCQECKVRGGRLEVDHIKPFWLIMFENGIKNLNSALECCELWDIDNGRTLCHNCHVKTATYAGRAVKITNLFK